MAASNFDRCLANVFAREGGYSDNPLDPGGATNMGITQAVFAAWWRTHSSAPMSVKAMPRSVAADIYRDQYWTAIRGDDLPKGIDDVTFDEAVNSGPVRAAKDLQHVLGVAEDGHIGFVTLSAAASADPRRVINEICDYRLSWLRRLRGWKTFGRGWTNRVEITRKQALAML
jgi:lysozyme family protein